MMKKKVSKSMGGFSLIELMVAMVVILVLMGIVSVLLSRSLGVRHRESQRTDALTSAQAALNIISREVANAGFGIYTGTNNRLASNGIIAADSSSTRIHFRANVNNVGPRNGTSTATETDQAGEDITYFFDADTRSIVRYDPNDTPRTSVVVNRISSVTFQYFDYAGVDSSGVETAVPTQNTGRVRITVLAQMDPVQGQPNPLTVSFTSDVTLRNSSYMLNQY